MKSLLTGLLALSFSLSPVTMLLIVQPGWGETISEQRNEFQPLLDQAAQEAQQGNKQQAIATYEKVLGLAQRKGDRETETSTLNNLALIYVELNQYEIALKYYNQALQVCRITQNRDTEAIILSNIGEVYKFIGQSQQALTYYEQSLLIAREVKNRQSEAITLSNIGSVYQGTGQYQQALLYFQQALQIAREVNATRNEAITLLNMGNVYGELGQPERALEVLNQALNIVRVLRDRNEEATTFNNIATIYWKTGRPQQALEVNEQALAIQRELKNRRGEATTLNNMGLIYWDMGQPDQALQFFSMALPIHQAIQEKDGQAKTLNNMASVYQVMGQPGQAIKLYEQSLKLFQELNNPVAAGKTLNNIGFIYQSTGEPKQALKFLQQALPLLQAAKDPVAEAITLVNIGSIYAGMGQSQETLDYYNRAIPLFKQAGDRGKEARVLSFIGQIYQKIGQPEKALDFHNRALPIHREVKDPNAEAQTLQALGDIHMKLGQTQLTLGFYEQALSLVKASQNREGEAALLSSFGGAYLQLNQLPKALEFLNQALPIYQEIRNQVGEANTLNSIGATYFGLGQPQKAIETLQNVLQISQKVGDRSLEASVLANLGAIYQATNQPTQTIDVTEQSVKLALQMRGGLRKENRQAFLQATNHKAVAARLVSALIAQNQPDRAYEWANLFTTADLADYTRLLQAKVANPKAQQAINQWNQQNQQLQVLYEQLQQSYSDSLAQKMRELEQQVNQQADVISRNFPEVTDLFETRLTDISKLRASIPAGTTVIHPIVLTSETNSTAEIILFIINRESLSLKKVTIPSSDFNNLLNQTYVQLKNRFDENYLNNLAGLYNLLIRPIEPQIRATNPKQISIIATDKLRYLPFEALYDSQTDQYLIQKYSINYLTRLSTRSLSVQPRANTSRRVLALGNPILQAPLTLPGAETEVQSITQILPGSEALIGSQATLAAFKLQSLRFPLIHLATHGCFQKGGCPKLGLEENTILFADQRFNIADAALLGLQNVDLIVLSACQTALQTESNGEEIAGLAYVFERAGAKATIASLWSAEDKTTQAIMVQFYQNLKQGMSKGEALQKAKLTQIESHPFFWAAFVLIGDAR